MFILVTGGAGFIGSHTVDRLLGAGHRVRVLDALTPPVHPTRTVPSYLPADVDVIVGDVRDRAAWEQALAGVDAVVHLAAYQDYLTDFSRFFDVNSVGTALLYEIIVARALPIQKVVVASSQAVYGEAAYNCPRDGRQYPDPRPVEQLMRREWEPPCPVCGGELQPVPTNETTVKPHNQYATSKYTQELISLNLGRRYEIPTTCLRFSITQGPRQSFSNAYSGILRIFTTRLLNGRQPVAYEDGRQLRDYVYVGDVARAIEVCLTDHRSDDECYNVGGREAVSVLDYAAVVARVTGIELGPLVPGEFRFGDTRHVVSDSSKLEALGWEPATPLDRIVELYVEWARAQPGLRDYSLEAEQQMKASGTVRVATP